MTCPGIIPGTFIACGEGSNYCSAACETSALRHQLACARIERDDVRLELRAVYDALTSTQARCTELLLETRELRRRLEGKP